MTLKKHALTNIIQSKLFSFQNDEYINDVLSAKHKRGDRYDKFFSQIPQDLIQKLYKYCQRDYEMLGYPKPKYVQ